GCAIECRINAEDAAHVFRPATGTVLHMSIPAGPGVRFDSHLADGLQIGSHYDSLLGKLIKHGTTREETRLRMFIALSEFSLLGVINTAAFLRDVVASDHFTHADLSTHFIDEFFQRWDRGVDREALDAAVIAAAMAANGVLGTANNLPSRAP